MRKPVNTAARGLSRKTKEQRNEASVLEAADSDRLCMHEVARPRHRNMITRSRNYTSRMRRGAHGAHHFACEMEPTTQELLRLVAIIYLINEMYFH